MKSEYVLGFLFDSLLSQVVLIHKTKPAWQDGKLNGVGGKIEVGETPVAAMRREFNVECGLSVPESGWTYFCRMGGDFPSVHCFAAIGRIGDCRTMTDEAVEVFEVREVIDEDVIENLPWLIELAIDCLTDGWFDDGKFWEFDSYNSPEQIFGVTHWRELPPPPISQPSPVEAQEKK